MKIPRRGSSSFNTYEAIAPATRRTLSKVKSSAMIPRQPSVPNLISCAIVFPVLSGQDQRSVISGPWPSQNECGSSYWLLAARQLISHQLMQLLLVEKLYDLAHVLRLLPRCNQQCVRRFAHD